VTRRVLVLGGVDPSGGAGITADATVLALHGVQPLPVAVVLTAQNRHGFSAWFEVPRAQWRRALEAALGEGDVHAVKTGFFGAPDVVAAVADALEPVAHDVPVVVDPVLSATAGGFTAAAALARAYRDRMVPLAAVFTPNLAEAEAVLGGDPEAALAEGCRAVLCKDGHGTAETVADELFVGGAVHRFEHPRLPIGPVRGTGCALASALAAGLARGADPVAAGKDAVAWVAERLGRLGPPLPRGLPRTLPW
jgi:hydroxymethylpyrimidine/phosphomethylpyrimidine kinase